MHALRKYVQATGDEQFLRDCGAEMLVETARLWLDLGFYSDAKAGKFCINAVTGPDEYNTVVNNNAYTNLMAREYLRYAAQTVKSLRATEPDAYHVLVNKTALEPSEVEAWLRAAENMYVPYDEKLKIIPQDDNFLDREPWDSGTHRATAIHCCSFTIRSISTGSKRSNKQMWSWPCSCWAMPFR